jgi:tetraacyldisaccharide 4'-kinase
MRAPSWWQRNGPIPAALTPLAAIFAAITARRVARRGWQAPIPVICCGNASSGGTGKTTLTLDLVARLQASGETPHALLRGYGGASRGAARRVQAGDTAAAVGDEALLLAALAPTWVGANRAAAARAAIAAGASVLVMDDGLQNPSLAKTLSLLVIDGAQGFGNGRVIPAGPLREPAAKAAARCQAAVLIGEDQRGALASLPAALPALRAALAPGETALALAGRTVFAFAGIGRPSKFHATLAEAGATISATRDFPDHHPYRDSELAALREAAEAHGAQLVTTPKDFVRLPVAFRDHVHVAGVRLVWEDAAEIEAMLATAMLPKSGPETG